MAILEQYFPGVQVLTLDAPDFLVRAAVLVGSRRAVVFDTGCAPADMAHLLPLLREREPWVVYSHGDWDHVQGTAGLAEGAGVAAVVAHEACAGRFQDDVPARLAALRAEAPGVYDDVVLVPPDLTFSQSLFLDLGGLTLQLHHLPGHTADSLVGFVPEHGLLLAGDTAEIPWPCVDWDGVSFDHWIAGLTRWRQDPRVRLVVPAHGLVGGPETLDATIDYLTALRDGRDPVSVATSAAADPFYRETHQANLVRAARVRSRS